MVAKAFPVGLFLSYWQDAEIFADFLSERRKDFSMARHR